MDKIELFNNYCKKCKKITVMTPFQVSRKRGVRLCCTNCQEITAGYHNFNNLKPFDYELEEKAFDLEKMKKKELDNQKKKLKDEDNGGKEPKNP